MFYNCPRCKSTFTQRKLFRDHLNRKFQCKIIKKNGEKIIWKCDRCEKIFPRQCKYLDHFNSKDTCIKSNREIEPVNENQKIKELELTLEIKKIELEQQKLAASMNVTNQSHNTVNSHNTTNNIQNTNNYNIYAQPPEFVPLDYIHFGEIGITANDLGNKNRMSKKIQKFIEDKNQLFYVCRDKSRGNFSYLSNELKLIPDRNCNKIKSKMMSELSPRLIKEIEDKILLNQILTKTELTDADKLYLISRLENDPSYYNEIIKELSALLHMDRETIGDCKEDIENYKNSIDVEEKNKEHLEKYNSYTDDYQEPEEIVKMRELVNKLDPDDTYGCFKKIRTIEEIRRTIEKRN